MEKIEFRGMWVRGDFYNAADVDAMLADVRRLVEAGKKLLYKYCEEVEIEKDFSGDGCKCCACEVSRAIAAVERHLATNPQRSSPPPADNGRA